MGQFIVLDVRDQQGRCLSGRRCRMLLLLVMVAGSLEELVEQRFLVGREIGAVVAAVFSILLVFFVGFLHLVLHGESWHLLE